MPMYRRMNQSALGLLFAAACLCFTLPGKAAAQNGAPGNVVFAPFVSRLQGEAKNNLIRLSWIDSPDVRGPVYIYRSQSPFGQNAPAPPVMPVEVPYGVQSYIDEAESSGRWYYLVAASDEQGQRYDVVIPYNNMIEISVTEGLRDPGQNLADPKAQTLEETMIFSLQAAVQGDGVVVSFRTMDRNKSPVLYRGVQPIRTAADLLGAVIVQTGISSPFTDYPVPGIPYYYAVIFEEDLLTGRAGIFPGRNATTEAAEVPPGRYRVGLPEAAGQIRSMPLPLIALNAVVPGAGGLSEIPVPVPLSTPVAKALADIKPAPAASAPEKSPQTFSQDRQTLSGGEAYTLGIIVKDVFLKRDWENAREELLRFLSLPRSGGIEARARFYLGQVYYFTGQPREALFEFLAVQTAYPAEANDWIQASLTKLITPVS
jgi:hypothetical protein